MKLKVFMDSSTTLSVISTASKFVEISVPISSVLSVLQSINNNASPTNASPNIHR